MKRYRTERLSLLFSCLLVISVTAPLTARVSGPAVIVIDEVKDDLESDLDHSFIPGFKKDLRDLRILLTSVVTSDEFDNSVRQYLIESLKSIRVDGNNSNPVIECLECLTYRAETDGNQLFIKKGATTPVELGRYLKQYDTPFYANIIFLDSGISIAVNVNIYHRKDHSLVWSRTYRKRVLHLKRTGLTVSSKFYQSVALDRGATPFGLNFYTGERMFGFGSFGLQTGGAFGSSELATYINIGPYAELNLNEIFSYHSNLGITSLLFTANYGWLDTYRVISFTGGLKFSFGTLVFVSLEYIHSWAMAERDTYRAGAGYPSSIMAGFGFTFF